MKIGSKTVSRIVQAIVDGDSRRYHSAVEDARYTLNKQIQCAENRKDELIRVIYFNIIIFGSFVALLSLKSSPSLRVSDLRWYIVGSGILWLVSTGLAIRGLHESGLNVRFSIEGLDQIVNTNHTETEKSKIRLGLYKEIIDTNERVGSKCGRYARISIILTIYTTLVIGIGVIDAIIITIPVWTYILIAILLVALAYPLRWDIPILLGLVEPESDVVRVSEFL